MVGAQILQAWDGMDVNWIQLGEKKRSDLKAMILNSLCTYMYINVNICIQLYTYIHILNVDTHFFLCVCVSVRCMEA